MEKSAHHECVHIKSEINIWCIGNRVNKFLVDELKELLELLQFSKALLISGIYEPYLKPKLS